jgi:energy-converting hydrogenase B subunit I
MIKKKMRKKNKTQDMSKIVRTISFAIAVPITTFGLYVILHGHLTPGGGFAGGAIIANLTALFLVAFGRNTVKNSYKEFLSLLESLALVSLILLAFFGLKSTFFYNFLANTGSIFGRAVSYGINSGYLSTAGIIPLMNTAVGIEVFSALSLIIIVMYSGPVGGENN